MYQPRTDLALEAHEIAKKSQTTLEGVVFKEEYIENFKMTRVEIISEQGSEITGKPCGKYLTLHTGGVCNQTSDTIIRASRALSTLIKELVEKNVENNSPVLIAGLGNVTITADAIGPKSLEHVIVTRHIKKSSPALFEELGLFDIAALSPGVLSQTGVETTEIIKSVVDKICPSVVIAIDSLASKNLERLATTIQLSNTGISPGSGMGNRRVELNTSTLGIPVISIGIPTVVDAGTLAFGILEKTLKNKKLSNDVENTLEELTKGMNYFVTPKDTDLIIGHMSKIIGYGINLAFHKNLGYEEMVSLTD